MKTNTLLGALVSVMLLTSPMLYGQDVPNGTVSLESAIATALTNNPDIQTAKAHEEEAASDVRSARAGLFPKIALSEELTDSTDPVFNFGTRLRQGRFTSADFAPEFLNHPGAISNFASTAGASWTAFDWGETAHTIAASRALLKGTQAESEATRQAVAFATIRAYYRALLADAELKASAAAVERTKSFAKETHDRVDAGLALQADAMQAEVEVSMREEDRAQAESNVHLAYTELGGILGTSSAVTALMAPTGTPAPTAVSLPALTQQAISTRPDLVAMRQQIAATRDQIHAARAAFGPQLSTYGNVAAENPHLFGGGDSNWTVGAKLELRIFDGGERSARVAKSSAMNQQAQAAYRKAETAAQLDVERAYYAVQTAQRQYGIAAEMVAKTQESLRTAQDRYSTGLVTFTEVLRQQEQLRDMEIHQTEALHRWWISDAQLQLATGSLSVPTAGVKP